MKRVSEPSAPSINCLPVLVQHSVDYSLQVHLQTPSITASKWISKHSLLRHPSSHDHDLQVHLQTRSIMASKCISRLARSRPPSASPSRTIIAFKCIFKLARSRPPSASPNSLDCGLQVYPQTRSIAASKVHLQTRAIMAPERIPEFTRSSFSGAPRIALKHSLQPVQIYRV
jgi:hypothetical protein